MFLDEVAYLVHLFLRVEIARRVVGVADEYSFGAGCDELLEFLDGGQREALVDRRWDSHDFGACRDGECHIVGVGGFGHDDFVAGVEACHEGEEHRFGASGGDDDVVDVDVDVAEPSVTNATSFPLRVYLSFSSG